MKTTRPRPAVDPRRLVGPARRAFVDDLYALHERVFDGVDRQAFERHVLDTPAERTRIQVYEDQGGRSVGYAAAHFYDLRIAGRTVTILRGEMGFERAHRGNAAAGRFALTEGLTHCLSHPGRDIYYLGTLINPASYCMFSRRVDDLWPHWERPIQKDRAKLLRDASDACGLERVEGAGPFVRNGRWKTRETAEERRVWTERDDPRVRFFLRENPSYAQGTGLLTMFSVNLSTLARAGLRLGVQAAERACQSVFSSAASPAR